MGNVESVTAIRYGKQGGLHRACIGIGACEYSEIQISIGCGDLSAISLCVFIGEVQQSEPAFSTQCDRIKTVVSQISKRIVKVHRHV